MIVELPPRLQGSGEQQLAALRDYLVRLAQSLEQSSGAETMPAALSAAEKQSAAEVMAYGTAVKFK